MDGHAHPLARALSEALLAQAAALDARDAPQATQLAHYSASLQNTTAFLPKLWELHAGALRQLLFKGNVDLAPGLSNCSSSWAAVEASFPPLSSTLADVAAAEKARALAAAVAALLLSLPMALFGGVGENPQDEAGKAAYAAAVLTKVLAMEAVVVALRGLEASGAHEDGATLAFLRDFSKQGAWAGPPSSSASSLPPLPAHTAVEQDGTLLGLYGRAAADLMSFAAAATRASTGADSEALRAEAAAVLALGADVRAALVFMTSPQKTLGPSAPPPTSAACGALAAAAAKLLLATRDGDKKRKQGF